MWFRPSIGLWFGNASGKREKSSDEEESGGVGSYIHGIDLKSLIGLLLGISIGFGEGWGIFFSVVGGFSLLMLSPFIGLDFSLGFIAFGIGFHYRKKIGLGILFPLAIVHPVIAFSIGLALLLLGVLMYLITE